MTARSSHHHRGPKVKRKRKRQAPLAPTLASRRRYLNLEERRQGQGRVCVCGSTIDSYMLYFLESPWLLLLLLGLLLFL